MGMIQRQPPIFRPSYSAGGGGGNVYTFPLPAGRAMPAANLTLRLIYPRPDSEAVAGAFARHKLQPAGVPMRFPIGVMGGRPPFRYTISSDMPGISIGQDMPRDWYANTLQNYGMVMCDAPAIGTYTITATITDQDSNSVSTTVSISVVDKDDTTKFMWFAATSGNDSTGTGSYSNPYKTDLRKAFGSASTVTTIIGHVIFKESGTYTLTGHTNQSNGNVMLNNTKCPVVMYSLPTSGAVAGSATIDFAAGNFVSISGGNIADGFINELTFTGVTAGKADMQYFMIPDGQDRITACNLSYTNIGVGTAGTDNATPFFFSNGASSSDGTYNHYVFFRNILEDGRPSSSNSYGIVSAYGLKYALFEGCRMINSNAAEELYLKDSCQQITVRYCKSQNGFAVGAQNQNGGTTGEIEYVHCAGGDALGGKALDLAAAGASGTQGNTYISRCSFYGQVAVNSFSTATGTYACDSTIIRSSASPAFSDGGKSSSNTNAELQGSSAYIDTAWALQVAYLATYPYTRGAEISDQ